MDTKDILKSLSTLEQNLKNIDSARQQVLNTVNAYESTRIQLAKLSPEFQSISEQLTNVFNLIGSNQTVLNQEVSKKFKTIFSKINTQIDSLDNAAKAIQVDFKSACDVTSRILTETMNQSQSLLENGTQDALKQIDKKAKEELDKIANLLSTFKNTTKNIQDNFVTSTNMVQDSQKSVQNEIIGNFKKAINDSLLTFNKAIGDLNKITSELSSQKQQIINDISLELQKILDALSSISTTIEESKVENQAQYTDIIGKLKSLRDSNGKTAKNLSERFNNTDNALLEINNLINDKEKKIKAELAMIKKSNDKLSKLSIYLLIGVSISIVIGILNFI